MTRGKNAIDFEQCLSRDKAISVEEEVKGKNHCIQIQANFLWSFELNILPNTARARKNWGKHWFWTNEVPMNNRSNTLSVSLGGIFCKEKSSGLNHLLPQTIVILDVYMYICVRVSMKMNINILFRVSFGAVEQRLDLLFVSEHSDNRTYAG